MFFFLLGICFHPYNCDIILSVICCCCLYRISCFQFGKVILEILMHTLDICTKSFRTLSAGLFRVIQADTDHIVILQGPVIDSI